MKNEEAILLLERMKASLSPSASLTDACKDVYDALDLAIKSLSANDLVSRKTLKEYFAYLTNVKFKSWCEPGDGWCYFSEKEIEEFIDKCPR